MKNASILSLFHWVLVLFISGVAMAQAQFRFSFAGSPAQPAPDLGPTQGFLDPLAFDCIENDGPTWPAGFLADQSGSLGATTQGTYFCRVEQLDPGVTPGAQGWQMGFSVTGCNGTILAATATQTDVVPGSIVALAVGPGQ